ncbi:MAG: hypothetical protein CVU19_00630 [Betaproteobacteria bacterium HGW-Betaproteobacteria-13]|nr:MAG: hypothetical protein CVU19_00630 [Betaproteobacteria bacterium HGW-Betaproteobacteria-13]
MNQPSPVQPQRVLARGECTTSPDCSDYPCLQRLPLPGVVILVHGVNSDGEWYDAAEQGLCVGLNKRLARRPAQLAYPGIDAGELTPVGYTDELDPEGFVDPNRTDKTFTKGVPHNSPVIRFRWGYKADMKAVKEWGANVWLNEHDYWGGGPFANGCSTLADLWSEGLDDHLFLWITAQHVNPVPGRDVYSCPPRAYYVHAALRLARLIASIRSKQPDCPITLVCHSQGNMIGLGAAFLGEASGAVADTYVLANPPYNLEPENGFDSWSQRGASDGDGRRGRQTWRARRDTLKAFFDILRSRAAAQQPCENIDRLMANPAPQDNSAGFTVERDRACYGIDQRTVGRVTLYCNPHDQVISADTIRGIGWLGLSDEQIEDANAAGVFSQRVFAQGYPVGSPGRYHFWKNHWRAGEATGYWYPPSPRIRYRLVSGLESNSSMLGKALTLLTSVVLWPLTELIGLRVNAEPPEDWEIPVNAPALEPFLPTRFSRVEKTDGFDEGLDPAGAARNARKSGAELDPRDPYDTHGIQRSADGRTDDAPRGDARSEAQMRYEDRARLRMKARRAGMVDNRGLAVDELPDAQEDETYRAWRSRQIGEFLKDALDQNATDHSTIMTNPVHAERVLAYDVAIGTCTLTESDWYELRVEADWRYAKGLGRKHPHCALSEYFQDGRMRGLQLHDWIKESGSEAQKPTKIVDERAGGALLNVGSRV